MFKKMRRAFAGPSIFDLFLIVILLLLNVKLFGQHYDIVKITTENGLSHSTVFAMTQDDNGLMWIGTMEGLNSYDSHEIRTFYKEDHKMLPSNRINALLYANGVLWIGTDKGLVKYLPNKEAFEPVIGLQGLSINDIFLSTGSEIFISTGMGLYKINKRGKLSTLRSAGFFRCIVEYRTNVFWTVSENIIQMINSNGERIKEYELDVTPSLKNQSEKPTIFKLFMDSQSAIWVGSTLGLFQYDYGQDRFLKSGLIRPFGSPEYIVIRNIIEDH